MSSAVNSPIKWPGGKRNLLPQLLPILNSAPGPVGTYFEPFAGGASVFFGASPEKSILSDMNSRLMNFYKQIKTTQKFDKALNDFLSKFNDLNSLEEKSAFYYEIRMQYNLKSNNEVDDAVQFYFLNKAGFNGLYRENSKGNFNVPFSKRTSIKLIEADYLKSVKACLQTAELLVGGFEICLERVKRNDIVYLDPPYIPLTETAAFTSYQSDGFGLKEQKLLAQKCGEITEKGAYFLLSNSDTELTREIFSEFPLRVIEASRVIAASGSSRARVNELLISNIPRFSD